MRTIKVNAIITSIVTGTYRSGPIADPRWADALALDLPPTVPTSPLARAAASGGHSESGRIIGRGPAGADRGKKLKKWKEFDREYLTRIGECAIITITARQPALNFSGKNRL